MKKNSKYELINMKILQAHEEIDPENYAKLLGKINENEYVIPIIVDAKYNVILDGHHRVKVLKTLGYEKIPVVKVNYNSNKVNVISRRKEISVTKEDVIKRGLSGKRYPPKTSRHILNKPRNRVPLNKLGTKKIAELEITPRVAKNVLELIGNTPLVKINKMNPNPNVEIYAKLEGQNIGGSVKDRIALTMIEAAEKSGELTKDKIILEPTSGNTGIGLAMIAAVKGYATLFLMSAGASEERKRMLKAFGAELIETDAAKGVDEAIIKARKMVKENPEKYWMPYQFANENNPFAHYNGTANEIIKAIPDFDVFVAGMGTSGTLMGAGKRFKEYNPRIKVIGVEPELNHKIQGMKNMNEAIVPTIYDEKKLDKKVMVLTEDAYSTARELTKKEGLFVGMSAGAAMWVAIQEAKKMKKGKIVVIFPDRGEKYLSTVLFAPRDKI